MTDNEIRKRAEEFAKKMEEQLEVGIYDCEEDLKIEEKAISFKNRFDK